MVKRTAEGWQKKIKYNAEYTAANYDRVLISVPKGGHDMIKADAARHGVSINTYITDALKQVYGIDIQRRDD